MPTRGFSLISSRLPALGGPLARAVMTGVVVAAFSGCASHSYCAKPGRYTKAESVPPIQSVGDIHVQQSANAYLVPAPIANPVPFGQKVPNPKKPGKTMWACLDQPPPLQAAPAPVPPLR